MSNKLFDDVEALVARLRVEYDRLCREVPSLQSAKEVATEQLSDMNKQVVATQTKLENLKEEIAKRTASFNEWTTKEQEDVQLEKQSVLEELEPLKTSLTSARDALDDKQSLLLKKENQLAIQRRELTKAAAELENKQQVHDAWSKRLIKQEKDQDVKAKELTTREANLVNSEQNLDLREQKLRAGEEAVTADTSKSLQDRQAASKLLEDAKDHIADVDAREDALELRSRNLVLREQDLKRKKAALDDRRNTMIANGMLEA